MSPGPDDVILELGAVQGTAGVGTVVETGERAGGLRGKRVLVGPIDPCGECEVCRRGGAAVCPALRRRDAPLADRIVAAARWLVPLEGGLELAAPAAAAVAGDVALAYTIYARTGLGPREPVVVTGASPVARFLVEILIAKGLAPVVIADPARAAWCAWLAARGAEVVDVPGRGDVSGLPDRIRAAFRGSGARPWRVIAATSDDVAIAASLAGPRATLTVLAPVEALPGALAAREVTVITVAGAHPDLVVEAAAMCVKGEIDLAAGTCAGPNDELRAIVVAR